MNDAPSSAARFLRRIALLASVSILALSSAAAEQTEDALFDMAKQTDSLQKFYGTRFDNPDLTPLFDIHLGLNTMEFGSYPVITEFGKTEYSIMVAYSYFRVDIRKGGSPENTPFRFRGLDFSGKAVSLSKPFSVDGVGFSETRGQIGLQDMVLGLFTVMNIDFDAGFMRDRKIVSGFSDPSGSKTSGIELIGDFFVGQTSDSYSFYFGTGSGRLLDLSLRVRDTVESFNPSVSVLYLLQKTGWAKVPSYVNDADLWFHYSPDETLLGVSAVLDHHVPVKLPEGTGKNIKTNINDVMGYKLDAHTAFSITSAVIDDTRLELMLDYFGYYVKGGVSYMVDDRLIPFGATSGSAAGYRIGGGYTAFHAFDLCLFYSMNFSDYLEFLSGSYNHPTATFYFVFKF